MKESCRPIPLNVWLKILGIVMRNVEGADIKEEDQVIIVDGCKGNDNVASERGTVIGVIDHHLGVKPDDVDFLDIRSEYGASSTIIALYLQENGIVPTPDVATALAIGIHVDTGSLRRRPGEPSRIPHYLMRKTFMIDF